MSGNSAVAVQRGVENVHAVIDTHNTDLTGGSGDTQVSLIPTAVWADFVAGTFTNAGYITGNFAFSDGTETLVRIPIALPA